MFERIANFIAGVDQCRRQIIGPDQPGDLSSPFYEREYRLWWGFKFGEWKLWSRKYLHLY